MEGWTWMSRIELGNSRKCSSAPEALWILAGGETTGHRSPKFFQPWRGAGPKLRSGAPPGRGFTPHPVPVVSPPANIRRLSGTKNGKLFLEIYICRKGVVYEDCAGRAAL